MPKPHMKRDPALEFVLFCRDVQPKEAGSIARVPMTFTDVFTSVGFPEFPHPFEFCLATSWVGWSTTDHHVTIDAVHLDTGERAFRAADYAFTLDNVTQPCTHVQSIRLGFPRPMILMFEVRLDGVLVERFPLQAYKNVEGLE